MNRNVLSHDKAMEFERAYGQKYCPGRNKPVLFSGNNMKYYEQLKGEIWHSSWWTTHAGESLSYAFGSARKFDSDAVIFTIPFYKGNPAGKVLPQRAMNHPGENAYHMREGFSLDKQERGSVEVFVPSDLDGFVEKYCIRGAQERERTYLKEFKKKLSEIRIEKAAIRANQS